MTHRVTKYQLPPGKIAALTNYQLPPGKLWWLCRYSDGDRVSEVLFTDDSAGTWFQANALMGRELGFKTVYKVTLHGITQ